MKRLNIFILLMLCISLIRCSNSVDSNQIALKKVTFISDRDGHKDVFIMDISGEKQLNITKNISSEGYENYYPRFSPDGSMIVFTSYINWIYYIYIYDINDKQLIEVTSDGMWPYFTPDGTKLLFQSYSSETDFDVSIVDINGGNRLNLTPTNTRDMAPHISYDGSKIVYMSNDDIYIMNFDGTDKIKLTSGVEREKVPLFSPDGRLLYISETTSNQQIFIMDSDGNNKRNLSNSFVFDNYPSFSPDGLKLVLYTYLGDQENNVFIINTDGSNRINLTNNNGKNIFPKISPDGSQIIFASDRDGNLDIFLMDVDGSKQKNLTHSLGEDRFPEIQP